MCFLLFFVKKNSLNMKGFLVLIFSISSIFLFGQSKSSTERAALKRVVKEYKQAIATSDEDQFNDLFFSKSVPFVGVLSTESAASVKKGYSKPNGIDVTDHKYFINSIIDAEQKQLEKIYNIKTNSDGNVGSISFDYSAHSGRTMKQWGHKKWNLVKKGRDWVITDVVYSIHYADVETCPFDEEEETSSSAASEVATAPAPPVKKPSYKKKRKRIEYDDVDEEEEEEDGYVDTTMEDEEEEEYAEPVTKKKKVKKKKPFTVYVNDIKNRALMAGVQNVVKITYEGVDPTKIDLHLTAKEVEFRKQEDGSYILKPLRKIDDFPAYIRVGNKTINYTFKVKGIPLPVARLGRQQTSKVRSSAFKAEAGLLAVVPSPTKEVKQGKCRIQSFILTKNPDTKNLKSKLNKGGRYEQSTLKLVKSAKAGDVYVFEQIKCICAGERAPRKLKDLRFDIK